MSLRALFLRSFRFFSIFLWSFRQIFCSLANETATGVQVRVRPWPIVLSFNDIPWTKNAGCSGLDYCSVMVKQSEINRHKREVHGENREAPSWKPTCPDLTTILWSLWQSLTSKDMTQGMINLVPWVLLVCRLLQRSVVPVAWQLFTSEEAGKLPVFWRKHPGESRYRHQGAYWHLYSLTSKWVEYIRVDEWRPK